jgi:hypothetical protein
MDANIKSRTLGILGATVWTLYAHRAAGTPAPVSAHFFETKTLQYLRPTVCDGWHHAEDPERSEVARGQLEAT